MGMIIINGVEYASSPKDGFPPLIFSTEEREVGVWKDGKPLYEETLEFSSSDFSSYGDFTQARKPISTATIDVKQIIGYGTGSAGNVLPIPTYSGTSLNSHTYEIIVWTSSESGTNSVYIRRMGSYSSYTTFWVTVRYTKASDVAGSGKYTTYGGMAHHYSISEQVVGTWVDGKPLYEKVIDSVIPDDRNMNNVASFSNMTVRFVLHPMFIAPNGSGYISYTWNNYSFTYAATDSGIWVQRLTATGSPWDSGVRFRCVVQYTKTTD